MTKRIAIFCDGTWNSPDKTVDGIHVPTNVVKLVQAVRAQGSDKLEQIPYYDAGVGTSGSMLKRMYDGATGRGLTKNILQAYQFLIRNYVPGDELFFFGFSRGAFTVRSLAGLIRNCGILKSAYEDMADRALALYRSSDPTAHPRQLEATLFRRTYAVSDIVPVRYIGVWDTVGALGNPLVMRVLSGGRQFHDTALSSTVDNAYQALAVDEHRRKFEATLWHKQSSAKNQTLAQAWFAGVHSNVGGGYAKTGLSDIALEWIAENARTCGLGIDPLSFSPNTTETPEESWKGAYRIIPRYYRPIDIPSPSKGPTNECVHPSVLARRKQDPTYRPKNLEDYLARNPNLNQ